MNKLIYRLVLGGVIMASLTSTGWAASISDLIRQGNVVVSTSISHSASDKDKPVAVGEQTTLVISIATDTWFTQGTRISRFNLANAVVLEQSPFAVNSVERIKGKKYSKQLWEIPIFPIGSGEYRIPPISVEIGVRHDNKNVSGKLLTQPVSFTAHTPSPYMTDDIPWLVAENVSLEQNWEVIRITDSEDETLLHVGDAIERSVTLRGQSTVAMLMPALIDKEAYQGLNGRPYFAQDEYQDLSQRGERISGHIEKVTLVVDQPGSIALPEIKVLWWDPVSNQEKELLLPAQEWYIKHTPLSFLKAHWPRIALGLAVSSLLIIGMHKLRRYVDHLKATNNMPLWYQFHDAIRHRNPGKAESVVYKKLHRDHNRHVLVDPQRNTPWQESAQQLQQQRYARNAESGDESGLLKKLWSRIK